MCLQARPMSTFMCLCICLPVFVSVYSCVDIQLQVERFEKRIFLQRGMNNLITVPMIFNFPDHKHNQSQESHCAHTWESDALSHFHDEMY